MNTKTTIPIISFLCKGKSKEEINSAQDRFLAYISLVNRICTRITEEKADDESFDNLYLHGIP